MSKLVLMGSGETAPGLVSVHRQLLSSLGITVCVWLDTPYGFQENADILTAKVGEFFRQSLNHKLAVASYRHSSQAEVEVELCYRNLRQANYLFAGPGSPSYAQLHWSRSQIPTIFYEKLSEEGNVVVLASAAACAVGALCLPVYEIYKVGQDPHWLPGLNILPSLGYQAVVLPHFNNTVGGNHDTRFCFLGERRLQILESQLEPDLWIWGVDEHTAVTLDLTADSFQVQGKGGFTLRREARISFFEPGYCGSLAELRQPVPGQKVVSKPVTSAVSVTQGLLSEAGQSLAKRFQAALSAGDGLGAAQVLLDYEQLLSDWSGDSDVHNWGLARAQFRNLLAQIGEYSQKGLHDPGKAMGPLVESLLTMRDEARVERHFQRADQIRQVLAVAGIEVQDTPEGARWNLKPEAYSL